MDGIFLVFMLFGTCLSQLLAPDFSLDEKIINSEIKPKRLVAESFTKNRYTVPGYGARENEDESEPPFDPTPECGDQYFNLTEGAFGTIASPNYPQRYPPNLRCEWIIEGIPGTVVEATFFDLVTQPWLFSFSDYVQVSTTGSWKSYRRFAGDANHQMPFTFISKENRIAIRLTTSKWLNFRGFKMSYVVREMKATDDSPPQNEYGSAYNNDLTAICSSKPIGVDMPNNKYHNNYFQASDFKIIERMEKQIRIVNGVETLPHQYPFMVILLTNNGAFCGGSLIDPNHVLTAAFCLQPENPSEELQTVDLVFGVYNLTNRAENLYSRQIRSVQYPEIGNNVFIHPNYDRASGANDIAIVRVNKVKITKYVQPVFLPSVYSESNSFSGWTLRTLGWGSVDGDTSKIKLSPTLRQGAATVIPTSYCREEFSGSVTGNHICTKNPFIQPDPVTEEPSSTIESIDTTENTQAPTSPEPVDETETELPTESVPVNVTDIPTESEQPTSPESIQENNETMSHTEFASVAYETPCHGDNGGPLLAEFLENHEETEMGPSPNEAGLSIHDCVNAKQNGGGETLKNPQNNVCQRPKDTNEKWYVQVGVLSFGSRVCGRKLPVVYTRINAYLEWISYITGRHG